jgi:HPt (histidine-containing phosphotransfer) domain-containing protein
MSAIDLSYLEDLTGGDNEVMKEMIELLIEETPKHLENIKAAQNEKNWSGLRAEAHKIKPMFLYVGLIELNELCKQIEENAKNIQDINSTKELIAKLESGYNEVAKDLKLKASELS